MTFVPPPTTRGAENENTCINNPATPDPTAQQVALLFLPRQRTRNLPFAKERRLLEGDAPQSSVQATFIFISYDGVAHSVQHPTTRAEGAFVQKQLLLTVIATILAFVQQAQAQVPSPTLKKGAEFDLPGPPGKRFDYLTIDPDDHYLISAHLAAGQTYVIDLRTNQVVATVADTPGAEGVEYVSELKKFYTSNAGDNTIGVVDLRQMKVVKKLPTERKPDGSAYAAPFHKLYVSDERGKAEAVVDVTKDRIVKTLHFNSETGMPQYDPVARKVYVNLQDENIFAVIDPAADEVIGRYPAGRCKGNHGMTLDPEHHRAFLSGEENNLMTVFDLDKHEPIAYLDMAGGPDVIKFNPGLGRIYIACYSGAISIFHQDDPQHYRKLEDFKVQHAVHSLAVDPKTHRVYAPEQEENGKPVARMVVYEAVTGK